MAPYGEHQSGGQDDITLTPTLPTAKDEQRQDYKAQLQEMKRRWTCKVCQKAVVRCAFRPCGHLVTCWDCGQDIEDCFKCGREVGDRTYARHGVRLWEEENEAME